MPRVTPSEPWRIETPRSGRITSRVGLHRGWQTSPWLIRFPAGGHLASSTGHCCLAAHAMFGLSSRAVNGMSRRDPGRARCSRGGHGLLACLAVVMAGFPRASRADGAHAVAIVPDAVWDGEADTPHPGWIVIVRGQRIDAVGPAAH